MFKIITLFLFLTISQILFGQFSLSLTYDHKWESVDFWHKNPSIETRWEQGRFQFSGGIGFTKNRVNYISHRENLDYNHGPPGYSDSEAIIYDHQAIVTYSYINNYLALDVAIVKKKYFALFAGIYLQNDFLFSEEETNHTTETEIQYSHEWDGEWSGSVETLPTNYTEFNALEMRKSLELTGIHLSPRAIIAPIYLQLNLSIGARYGEWFSDAKTSYFGGNRCFSYKSRFGKDRAFIPSFGMSIGYLF